MRSIIVVGLIMASLISTSASASVESCAQTLPQWPNDALYANLQVTSTQAQQIAWIGNNANTQRAQLQAQLNVGGDAEQVALLEGQLASLDSDAVASVVNVLTPWQQSQCGDEQPMVAAAPPVIVAAPWLGPAYRRPVIVRPPAWPRYPVTYRTVVRPAYHPTPVIRRPAYAPAPIVRRPVYAPAPVAHRPAYAATVAGRPSGAYAPAARPAAHAPSARDHRR